jgi:hypothetical protein
MKRFIVGGRFFGVGVRVSVTIGDNTGKYGNKISILSNLGENLHKTISHIIS